MKQQVSIVYLTEKMPMATISNFVNMQEVIGEKYRNNNQSIVLKNPVEEIKILLVKDNLYCIDELLKVLPQEKRINAMLVKRGDSYTYQ